MTLKDWLAQRQLSASEFGKRIGKPQPTISRYANGERIPEPPVMALIVEATDGEVTANDFYGVQPAGASAA